MTQSLERMRKLAGLLDEDQPYILSSDEADDYDDRADDDRFARESKIKQLIQVGFKRAGLAIADDDGPAIFYDESDREATVTLEESDLDIDRLLRLKQTGLSDRYRVHASNFALDIVFIVSPALDRAV